MIWQYRYRVKYGERAWTFWTEWREGRFYPSSNHGVCVEYEERQLVPVIDT